MIVNWYLLVVGLAALFLPARWLTSADCRHLEFLQLRAMHIDKNRRRRRWWKGRHVWIEPVRGAIGVWALKEGVTRAPDTCGLQGQLPTVIVLAALGLSILLQVMGRRKKILGRRRTDEGSYGNAGDAPSSDASEAKTTSYTSYKSSSSELDRTGVVRTRKSLNAPLFFMIGMMVGLFGVSVPILVVAVILMGIVGLLAFHHWATACALAAGTMLVVGYLMLGRSIYVPAMVVLLMEPALVAWYLHRPLVMPVRI
ncbi:hypothetical protein [Geminisphaera colitermitum]|uniref:hypothetical protein n=1 Tax=Geminisphaera colitermitum TaxID=1148786 RepID=UPI0005BC561E|nr:hypothetical protein [Geminisphaera colitermitum]